MPKRIDGDKVIAMMEERDWTNSDLASAAGLSVSTIIRIKKNEAHNSSNYTVKYLAKAFGCQPADLYKPEAVNEVVNKSLSNPFNDAVNEAVVEVVTAVVEEVAPGTPPEIIEENIPPVDFPLPVDFNFEKYNSVMRELSHIKKMLANERKSICMWLMLTGVSAVTAVVCLVLLLLR